MTFGVDSSHLIENMLKDRMLLNSAAFQQNVAPVKKLLFERDFKF